ncbi:MAG: hypothetical protein Q4Q04_03725 [Methanocorpusculum sp.]|nr:hypothetical protein [Methanocorpusculum sp.]
MSETEPDPTTPQTTGTEPAETTISPETAPPQKKRRARSKKPTTEKPPEKTEDTPHHKDVPDQFIKDLNDFAAILEATPTLIDPIREVFEYHLVDPNDRKTIPKIVNAMSMLLGANATMVLMTACHVNAAAFFEDLLYAVKDNEKAKAAIWIIQHLTSLYGNRVQQAYTLSSGTMDEDWHTIDVNTYRREGETPTWTIDMKLMLYDGTQSHIRMTPDSAFQIVEILLTELAHNVPVEQVDDALVKKCRENCTDFYEKFYGGKNEEKEDEHPAGYA